MSTPDDPDLDPAPSDPALSDPAPSAPALSDPALSDPALGDSAMASGSDAGEPGEHLGPSELRPDEQRLLAELSRDVGGGPLVTGAPEDDAAAVRAAEDEAPLPAEGGAPDDGLTPRFSSPEHD